MQYLVNKKGMSTKLITCFIVSAVIFLLVAAGPGQALTLKLDGFKNTPYKGGTITFKGDIAINSDERVPITSISLFVNNVPVCTVDAGGSVISGCGDSSLILGLDTTSYGYGYGFYEFNPVSPAASNRSAKSGEYEGAAFGPVTGFAGAGSLKYDSTLATTNPSLKKGNNDLRLVVKTSSQEYTSRTEKVVVN